MKEKISDEFFNFSKFSLEINDSAVTDFNETELNSTTPFLPYEERISAYLMPIIFGFIFLIGSVGNGVLILIFFRHRAMRNTPNTYILSLAIADLLVILTTVPFTTIIFISDSFDFGEIICKASEFFKDLSIGVSVFTLTALSGDRYFAIVDPLRKFHSHGRHATKITFSIIASIWFLSIIMGIPALKASHIKTMQNRNVVFNICYPFPESWGPSYPKIVVMFRFLCYYVIPLSIIAVFYTLIAKYLMYSASNVPGELHKNTLRQVEARRKVALTVSVFVVIFGLCFAPGHVFFLWFYYNPRAEEEYNAYWNILRMVGFTLSFANSCSNPVALYFVSGTFRKHFNRYLLCQKRSMSRFNTHEKSHHELVSQSTIVRKYTARKFNQSLRRGEVETTIVELANGEDLNEDIINKKVNCV